MLSLLISAWKRHRDALRRRAALLELLRQNDWVLRDIGLSREDILAETGARGSRPESAVPSARALALDGRC